MAAKTPRPTPYDIKNLLRIRAQLSGPAWLDHYGTRLQGEHFEDFARCAHAELPKGTPFAAVYQSLQAFAGQDLTPGMGDEAAWRLAGNVHRLKKGVPVYPWRGQLEEESVPMVVEAASPAVMTFQRSGVEENVRGGWIKLLILGGLPAGRVIQRFWSWRFVRFVRAGLGFSLWDRSKFTADRKRLKNNFPLVHLRQLVQLRLSAGLEADCDPAGPRIVGDKVKATPSMVAYNRVVLGRRQRRDGFVCLKNWDRPCHLCPVGFENCPAATHRKDYVGRHCAHCGQADRPFDPESLSSHCVDCSAARS